MTPLSWLWLTIVLATAAVLVVLFAVDVAQSTRGRVRRSFRCPTKDLEVTATFDADFLDPQRYSDVLACSAFPDPRRLDCGRACLRLAKDELRRQDRERAAGRDAALAVG